MNNGRNSKVVVAISGGVDSSVAAALLKKQGYEVIGVFMKFWSDGYNRCCSSESEKRARQVAKVLGIPFYVFNFEKEFKKRVVESFLKEIKVGNTPNPCVVCNKEIKFGLLLEKALKLGAEYVATGHYVKIKNQKEIYKLLKAKDNNKDQSYFLWQLNQNQLSRILFPIGNYTKPEVRELAKKFKLPTAKTPESQEICFVPKTINDFLRKHLKPKKGKIIHQGKTIGEHEGLIFYTIGQRKGIKLPNGPYFVLDKDFKNNNLIVTKNEKDLFKKELSVKNINWISKQKLPLKAKVKIRYRSKLALASVSKNKIKFNSFQRAVTPGQSAVFYKGQELLGGGIIDKVS